MLGIQAAQEAGRALEFMKLGHHLAAMQRRQLRKHEAAYEVYQVRPLLPLHLAVCQP